MILNILLVEDDDVDVMNVQRAFKKSNISNPVWVAGNGLEALTMLRDATMPAGRRLILLDLNMPRMGGIEFLRALRADPALRGTPVVVLTTSADDRDKVEAYDLNVAGYLLKPVTAASFVEAMAALHNYWTLVEMPLSMDHRLSILLVDDDEIDRMAVRRALGAAGLDASLTEVTDADEALAALSGSAFDCALLDLRLPRMSGIELLQELRARGVETPVVVLTGQGDEQTAVEIMKAGAVDYISKSAMSPERLSQSVRHAVRVHEAEREATRYAAQLEGLAAAAIAIPSAPSLGALLEVLTSQARAIVGAHQAVTAMTAPAGGGSLGSISLSDRYASLRPGPGLFAEVDAGPGLPQAEGPRRLTQQQLEQEGGAGPGPGGLPLRGLLSAPLLGRTGQRLGRVQLSDKVAGDFTEQDEDILVQLSQMGAVAIENKRLFELAERERARAEAANQAKDEFLAVLSHELRTPLNAILGWARMMRDGELSARQTSQAVETIERNALTQVRLIEDLLDVSRIISGKLRIESGVVALRPVVDAAVGMVRALAEARGVTLTSSYDPVVTSLAGDPARLQQVLWNLLANAIKFTPRGGSVKLTTAAAPGAFVFTVRDTGAGISAEFLPHVFERFRQADGSITRGHGGLGLGLSIVQHLVELHHGTVRAESEGEGKGATFTVTLPRDPAGGEPTASEKPSDRKLKAASATLSGLAVLVVEDDDDSREVLRTALALQGAVVTEARGAAEADRILAAGHFDVLISDIGMPGRDGYDLMRGVRGREAADAGRLFAIALTGFAALDDQRRARDAGFDRHITKPVDIDALLSTLARIRRG